MVLQTRSGSTDIFSLCSSGSYSAGLTDSGSSAGLTGSGSSSDGLTGSGSSAGLTGSGSSSAGLTGSGSSAGLTGSGSSSDGLSLGGEAAAERGRLPAAVGVRLLGEEEAEPCSSAPHAACQTGAERRVHQRRRLRGLQAPHGEDADQEGGSPWWTSLVLLVHSDTFRIQWGIKYMSCYVVS